MSTEVIVVWRFNNGHVWSQAFDEQQFANDFIVGADLMGHPDIRLVATITHGGVQGSETTYLKGDPNVL
jgi:hypothetical protein